jgi:hypothetical protein
MNQTVQIAQQILATVQQWSIDEGAQQIARHHWDHLQTVSWLLVNQRHQPINLRT